MQNMRHSCSLLFYCDKSTNFHQLYDANIAQIFNTLLSNILQVYVFKNLKICLSNLNTNKRTAKISYQVKFKKVRDNGIAALGLSRS
uniref:Uncharacterized protein n=1 Tax=Onchocerca volvulus TaxID=6282 RepID=A0A8R1Y404_ONCVO